MSIPRKGLAVKEPNSNNEIALTERGFNFPHLLGPCTFECLNCSALHWAEERTIEDNRRNVNLYSMCCHRGKVVLPSSDPLTPKHPDWLTELFTGNDTSARAFQRLTRVYNNSISFTSLGSNFKPRINQSNGPSVFTIRGGLTHRIGDICPEPGKRAAFAQIFVVGEGGEGEARDRIRAATGGGSGDSTFKNQIDLTIVQKLQEFMYAHNPYARLFKKAGELIKDNKDVKLLFMSVDGTGRNPKRYNQPSDREVGIVIEGSGEVKAPRQILLHSRDGGIKIISDLHSAYFPLRYPLFFPYGSQQWEPTFKTMVNKPHKVSQMEWFAYLLFARLNIFSAILLGRLLFQEFLVDSYVCIERSRLNYFRYNQDKLKAELYQGTVESLGENGESSGKKVILPSSFIGGPRAMSQLYQDAMALVREYGPPSLFITMTANPRWPEIMTLIPAGDDPIDHPTIVARVFHLKFKELLACLLTWDRLGKVVSYVWVVEFQKRGLPHVHIMLTLDSVSRPRTPFDVDLLVSAEIPDPTTEPQLHGIVRSTLLHGPCKGRACSVQGKCRFRFPKDFREDTVFVEGAYPAYRRRKNGPTIKKGPIEFDNRHVVPHNKFLSLHLNCHINVEVAVGIEAVKYLYKYITKGHDRAYLSVQDNDETAAFLDGRYIGPPEGWLSLILVPHECDANAIFFLLFIAAWRLFRFEMSDRLPAVQRLAIHEEGPGDDHYVNREGNLGRIHISAATATTLTDYFRLCRDGEQGLWQNARDCTYADIPKNFWWNEKTNEWQARKKPLRTVGRMHFCSIHQGEKYYIRLLLAHRRNVLGHEDLRTVGGRVLDSFREAADSSGLLVNDSMHQRSLSEASFFKTGFELRLMFAIILVHSPPASPRNLFENNISALGDDVRYKLDNLYQIRAPTMLQMRAFTLHLISGHVKEMGKTLDMVGIRFSVEEKEAMVMFLGESECWDDKSTISARLEKNRGMFNPDQVSFFKAVTGLQPSHVDAQGQLFYLDGPGGTGKTFLLNSLIDHFNLGNRSVCVVASTGVAALLLTQGQTAHSAFKIPLELTEMTMCEFDERTYSARSIQAADLVIWDEIVTMHMYAVHAVDRGLRQLMKNDNPFGGKRVVFSGDFRQTLPVVGFEDYPASVDATIKSSYLWPEIRIYTLTLNMRLRTINNSSPGESAEAFSQELLALGEGRLQDEDAAKVSLARVLVCTVSRPDQLTTISLNHIYGNIRSAAAGEEEAYVNYLSDRAILTPLNIDSRGLNEEVTKLLNGRSIVSRSIDTPDDSVLDSLPPENLNRLDFPGFPQHRLELKVGIPVMLLRNINIKQGLCNGSRLVITYLTEYSIGAKLMTGRFKGREVCISKITLRYAGDIQAKVPFYRYQFPLVVCFSMTINKSQGQTLNHVVVMLKSPVFAHGQLYVALSRVTSELNLRVLQLGELSSVYNVVHRRLL